MLDSARYGRKVRKKYNTVKDMTSNKQVCPKCGKKALKRQGFALYVCKSCGAVIAGGAYEVSTDVGKTVNRLIATLNEGEE